MSDDLLDTHGFTAFIADLARMGGKDFLPVLIDQTGTILDLCIARSPDPWKKHGRSKVRNLVELRIQKPGRYIGDSGTLVSAINRVPRPVPAGTLQTMTGTRGGAAGMEYYIGRNRKGKRIVLTAAHMLGNEKWHRRQEMKFAIYESNKPAVLKAIESIGSVKASWVALADMVGAPLRKSEKWVQKVRRQFNDGARSRIVIEDAATFIELVNTNTLLINKYNGRAIMQGAIDTRLKAFQYDIQKGAFDDIKYRASRYPGIFTN